MQRFVRSLLGRDRSPASVAPELPSAIAVVPEGLRMAEDWDRRAREDARWHIASDVTNDEEFATTGRRDVDVALGPLDDAWLRDARALEIGCGTGRMTEFLLRRVRALDAIDVSSEMIERARDRLGDRPNLRLLATSGRDLAPFADDSFELVLSYVVLQHIPNAICRLYFREIRRVLQAGGVFRGQVARITAPGFQQPSDHDSFSMRSWSLEELRAEFEHWGSAQFEVNPVTATTDHIWITARS